MIKNIARRLIIYDQTNKNQTNIGREKVCYQVFYLAVLFLMIC